MSHTEQRSVTVGKTIVVATPDPGFRSFIQDKLQFPNGEIEFVTGGAEALSRLEAGHCAALLLDAGILDLDVNEVKEIAEERHPGVGVWIAHLNRDGLRLEDAHGSRRIPERLLALRGSPEIAAARFDAAEVSEEASAEELDNVLVEAGLPGMVGRSAGIRRVQKLVRLVAARKTSVLLSGETGTGKELVARAIHQLGPRSGRPFVVINCSAIPEALFESELFGYRRGAFTGAVESRLGRIHDAHLGTLFLDEVGELPLSMQAKLLRYLQEGEVQRLGSQESVHVDARVIAASNADLWERVLAGSFREDFYYRLNVFPIVLSPLRERPEDIEPLLAHFLDELSAEADAPRKYLSPEAMRMLMEHAWPGNVRELKHCTERAFILAEDSTLLLPEHFRLRSRERNTEKNLMNGR